MFELPPQEENLRSVQKGMFLKKRLLRGGVGVSGFMLVYDLIAAADRYRRRTQTFRAYN